ncbi:MAG: hypothetical protein FJ029_11280 [Actinobacteria bacterium]|nr:hypothetical protein [Actinomycetota bacterium]
MAIATSGVPATLARDLNQADVVMTLRNFYRKRPRAIRDAEAQGVPIYVLRSNTVMQMEGCLADLFDVSPRERAAVDQPVDARGERRRSPPNGQAGGGVVRDGSSNGPAAPPNGAHARRLRLSTGRDRSCRPW